MKISRLHFFVAIYLALPVIIFCVTWLRWYWALLALLGLSFCFLPIFRLPKFRLSEASWKAIDSHFFWLIVLALGWTYLAGVGEWRPQHFDYFKHNLILNNLVRFDWPVRYADSTYLCYYVAYYLPAAALAKLIGGVAAVKYYIFGWTWLGISLLFIQLSRLGGLRFVLFFMFFNSPEAILLMYEALQSPHTIAETLADLWNNDHTIELIQTPGGLMLPSHVESLTAAPQHALPAWLATGLLLQNIKDKLSVSAFTLPFPFVVCFIVLWSPMVALGLFPFSFLGQKREGFNLKNAIFQFSILIIISSLIVVYYAGHVPIDSVSGWWWTFLKTPHEFVLLVTFLILEVGIWLVLIGWGIKKQIFTAQEQKLLWGAIGVLFFCTLYRYGYYNDLARRASLPATLVVCWGIFQVLSGVQITSLARSFKKKILHTSLLIVLLLIIILPLKHHLRWFTKQPYTAVVDKKIADFTPYTIHRLSDYHRGEFEVVSQYLGRGSSWYSQYFAPFSLPKSRQISRGVYYWKTTFHLTDLEKQFLKKYNISQLYIRLFDVDWDFAMRRAVPKAVIEWQESPPLPFIPVVFMTNRTLENLSWGGVEELAGQLAEKLTSTFSKDQPEKIIPLPRKGGEWGGVSEIQFDCDWTPSTRAKYFRLLTLLQQKMPAVVFSATIRLHQIKYYRATGVPPVSKGMLMYYNMADWKNPQTQNSILDLDVARRYANYISDYPLSLDAVLPIFAWTIVFRNDKPIKIINHLTDSELYKYQNFRRIGQSNHFVALTNHQAFGFSVREGDVFRVEEISREALAITSHLLLEEIQHQSFTFAYYHLDSLNLSRYATLPFPPPSTPKKN
ncbi:MAG: hypothetical protein ACK4GN_15745 [Runella sp.]